MDRGIGDLVNSSQLMQCSALATDAVNPFILSLRWLPTCFGEDKKLDMQDYPWWVFNVRVRLCADPCSC